MNYAKIDAALAAALAGPAPAGALGEPAPLTVLVQLTDEVVPAEREALAGLGLGPAARAGAGTCTATLTTAEVAVLSDRPSVRRIQLSGRLRPRPQPRDRPQPLDG